MGKDEDLPGEEKDDPITAPSLGRGVRDLNFNGRDGWEGNQR